ncbi:MAG TPA: alpha-2-macroglobulin family protein [Blastocatellia bacterium]|nr:alpha-2-macroglobulin family protein [Blastocatellia bacterium]
MAETNAQFGTRKYYYNYFLCRWGYFDEISGVNFPDLLALDFAKPIPDDLSLVAELMLNRDRWRFYRASSRDFEPNYAGLYAQLFSEMRARVVPAVVTHLTQNGRFPVERAPITDYLSNASELKDLVDPWGTPYKFKTNDLATSLYKWDGRTLKDEDWSPYSKRLNLHSLTAVSAGPDKTFDTGDDISQFMLEYPSEPITPSATAAIHGRIYGYTGDSTQIRIVATRVGNNSTIETHADKDGIFKLTNIPAGMYKLEVGVNGKTLMTFFDVVVLPRTRKYLSFSLSAEEEPRFVGARGTGFFSATTTFSTNAQNGVVAFDGDVLHSRQSGLTLGRPPASPAPPPPPPAKMREPNDGSLEGQTPRLRQYFPETLVWQPQLITDSNGIAKLEFPTADSITTWQLAAVGSTVDGKIGTGSAEIRAFQEFFADPQLPPTLTEGDQINLPVVVRNYMDQAQAIKVSLNSADWFNLTSQSSNSLTIDPGTAAKVEFALRALKPGSFTARIDAIGHSASDAVERPIRVGYDGREIVSTQGDIVNATGTYEIDVPADAIPGSAKTVLKLYPNLLSSALDGIEGMTQRPWGCLEQTISSTYGNLLILRYLKDHPQPANSRINWAKIERKARKNLEDGIQRVYTFPTSGGGFSYFGGNDPDLALTGYALQFLTDAKEFVEVKPEMIKNAHNWLESIQGPDGSWKMRGHYWERQPRFATTAYVVYALTKSGYQGPGLQKAFSYLDASNKAMNEGYALALYTLAAEAAKDQTRVSNLIDKLATLAVKDRDGAHWGPPERTLFYGWGRGGEVEATALAIQALASNDNQSDESTKLINQGLLYLARLRDRTGSWYSTQATVQAIKSLIDANLQSEGQIGSIQIAVNGQQIATADASQAGETGIIPVDVTKYLTGGANHLQMTNANGGLVAVQLVSGHYVKWDDPTAQEGGSDKFAINVTADKQEAKVGEEIKYSVIYKRSDWQISGMSIVEVGLPPGVEVDRSSLESLLKNYTVSKYSVTPDHVIFYVWPNKAAQSLSFTVRPRLAMTAKTASTIIYDYYNPDAYRVAAPLQLVVR